MLGPHLLTLGLVAFPGRGADDRLQPLADVEPDGFTREVRGNLLFFMSAWSIGVMIDRWIAFTAARKQSRVFAPFGGGRAEGRQDRRSHLHRRAEQAEPSGESGHRRLAGVPGPPGLERNSGEEIEASKRALERAAAIVHAELKRGVSSLATIGSTAPFVGLFGTVLGIINAFGQIQQTKTTGLTAVAGGIAEALITTAFGIFVAVPAVWMYNYFTSKIEAFDVEMDNSSSELIDYFLKRAQRGKR